MGAETCSSHALAAPRVMADPVAGQKVGAAEAVAAGVAAGEPEAVEAAVGVSVDDCTLTL